LPFSHFIYFFLFPLPFPPDRDVLENHGREDDLIEALVPDELRHRRVEEIGLGMEPPLAQIVVLPPFVRSRARNRNVRAVAAVKWEGDWNKLVRVTPVPLLVAQNGVGDDLHPHLRLLLAVGQRERKKRRGTKPFRSGSSTKFSVLFWYMSFFSLFLFSLLLAHTW
jgi:hypothetical protein